MSEFPWTTPRDILEQLRKRWDSGAILADRIEPGGLFPLRLRTRNARSRDLSEKFDRVRAWVAELRRHDRDHCGHGYEIHWREVNHRTHGRNQLPKAIVIPSRDDALRMLGKTRAAAEFERLANEILGEFPELRDWLAANALKALDRAEEWAPLKRVLHWFRQHPRAGIYLRQLDIPGVDTKFIEARRALLTELLDRVMPPDTIDQDAIGARRFERRYGLKRRAPLIRFRVLDPEAAIAGLTDLSVLPEQFAGLDPPVSRVFITENEINGLAFPDCPNSWVIFGLGYGFDRLSEIEWLKRVELWYWGDIDTHGFAILNRLRHHLPHARSLLMDRATLDAHRDLCVQEPEGHRFTGQLDRLGASEHSLYESLRDDVLGPRVRLEQERISYAWLRRFLVELTGTTTRRGSRPD